MNLYQKQENETIETYIDRLLINKDQYCITWNALYANIIDTIGFSPAIRTLQTRRKHLIDAMVVQSMQDQDEVIDAEQVEDIIDHDQMLELKKLKYQLSEERAQNAVYIRRLAREDTIKEIAKDAADKISEKVPFKQVKKDGTKNNASDYEGVLVLSDWHYGMVIDNYFNTYNTDICRERLNTLYTEVVNRCKLYNIKTLTVANLSDLISGRIHLQLRLQTRIDVITQIIEVSEILSTFLEKLSTHFNIKYYDCLDNHSRLEPNKNDSLDLESLCRITHWYIKERTKDNDNISVIDNVIGMDIIKIDCKGFNIAGVHGHDDGNNVVTALTMVTKDQYDLILTSHFHHFAGDEINGVLHLSNGALMGTDDYAIKKRKSAKPSQLLIIVSDNNVADSIHRIILG